MKKKILISLAAIVFLLIIFNPSESAFRSYARSASDRVEQYHRPIFKRKSNFLLCSIYTKEFAEGREVYRTKKYLGIIGNFFLLSDDDPLEILH